MSVAPPIFEAESIDFSPIGWIESAARHPYELPRQGALGTQAGVVRLNEGHGLELSSQDLAGFERLWIVAFFHRAEGWKPKVLPPRSERRRGVLSTRSPYRPNPIALSCVRLVRAEPLALHVEELDLLDGTPVLDIKPYLPYSDSFPDAATGWIPTDEVTYQLTPSPEFGEQLDWLEEHQVGLRPSIETQLTHRPLDTRSKRITVRDDAATLAVRTWRIDFRVHGDERVELSQIRSGYSIEELASNEDRYSDKEIHRAFRRRFDSEPSTD